MIGREIMVEAYGCDAERLTSISHLKLLFDTIVRELSLHPVGEAQWHQFPEPGGVTGLCMLAESHLTLHTFPEYHSACLNLFCCTPRADWAWEERLEQLLGATHVRVRATLRPYAKTRYASDSDSYNATAIASSFDAPSHET